MYALRWLGHLAKRLIPFVLCNQVRERDKGFRRVVILSYRGDRRLPIAWGDGSPIEPLLKRRSIQIIIVIPVQLMPRGWRSTRGPPVMLDMKLGTHSNLCRLGRSLSDWENGGRQRCPQWLGHCWGLAD